MLLLRTGHLHLYIHLGNTVLYWVPKDGIDYNIFHTGTLHTHTYHYVDLYVKSFATIK